MTVQKMMNNGGLSKNMMLALKVVLLGLIVYLSSFLISLVTGM